jgi:hypothetical protein
MNASQKKALGPANYFPAPLQTFSKENERERLSSVALKAYLNLTERWGLSNTDSAALLGVSGSTWDRIKGGKRPTLNQDQLTRISAAVGTYKGLHLLFADEMSDRWPSLENTGPLFRQQTPIVAMINGGIPKMLEVRQYIDAVRGGI